MDPNKGYGKGQSTAQNQQAQGAQQNQQAPVGQQSQQAQAAQQNQQAPAGQQNQQAQVPQQNQQGPVAPKRPTSAQQLALNWVGAAFGLLFEKPSVTISARPQFDPLKGQSLRLEFVAGSYSGNTRQPIAEPPVVRLTAGGRPVAKVNIDFYVSDGQLPQGQTATVATDQAGEARIPQWTLGAPGRHSVTAEYLQLQQQRTIRVN